MFDYTITHWVAFFSTAVLLNLSPGPDMAFILAQTLKRGVKYGFSAMFGIWIGTFMHVIFATLGLSIILTTSAVAFSIVKWVGAFYLVWLGIQSFLSKKDKSVSGRITLESLVKVFRQGIIVATFNPKVALFFLAFLPQFVEEGAGSVNIQLFLHGFLIIAVAAFVEPPLILISAKLSENLKRNSFFLNWLDKAFGTLLIGLGIKLAATE